MRSLLPPSRIAQNVARRCRCWNAKITLTCTCGNVENKPEASRAEQTLSICKGTSFEETNFTLEEMLKYTYWWRQDLDQCQIRRRLKINPDRAVDWDSICREICEVTRLQKSEKIGGPEKQFKLTKARATQLKR